jgi:CubicO group peptidase (beta-lactamase class C family)
VRARSRAGLATVLALALGAAPAPQRAAEAPPVAPRVAQALALLDLWVEEQIAYRHVPGLSLGVVQGGELVWARGYGFADLATRTPATPETLYRLGSITKVFTATAVLQLRDAGRLALDDPLARHLPDFAVENPFPGAPAITLRHLLTHTAGLPRDADIPAWTTHEFPTREEVFAAVRGQTLLAPPGERYHSSNLGMGLLGHVVEAVSGQAWADYLHDHVTGPLGMADTTGAPTAEHHRRRAISYLRRMPDGSRDAFPYYDLRGLAAAGNLISSVTDLARFASLQLGTPPPGGERVLGPFTVREMHRLHFATPGAESGRGLGYGVSRGDATTFVSHGGWIGGNRSHLLLAPESGIAVIALTNADDVGPTLFTRAAFDLVAPALLEGETAVGAPPPGGGADPGWARYLGAYTDPWGWEYRVLVLDDRLALYAHDYPPADDPGDGVVLLTPAGERTFRLPDGELVSFELGPDGAVARLKRRADYLRPVGR